MSQPEFSTLATQIGQQTDEIIGSGWGHEIAAEDLSRLVSSAVRLYAAANEGAEHAVPPTDGDVSTTDAVVMACALLKAHDLNPFDLALWFSRSRVAG